MGGGITYAIRLGYSFNGRAEVGLTILGIKIFFQPSAFNLAALNNLSGPRHAHVEMTWHELNAGLQIFALSPHSELKRVWTRRRI